MEIVKNGSHTARAVSKIKQLATTAHTVRYSGVAIVSHPHRSLLWPVRPMWCGRCGWCI